MTTTEPLMAPNTHKLIMASVAAAAQKLKSCKTLDVVELKKAMNATLADVKDLGLEADVINELLPLIINNNPIASRAKSLVRMGQFETYSKTIAELNDEYISHEQFYKIDVADTVKSVMYEMIVQQMSMYLFAVLQQEQTVSGFQTRVKSLLVTNGYQPS